MQSRPRGTTFWVIRHTWPIHEKTTVELNEKLVSGRIQAQTLRGELKNTFIINKPIKPRGLLSWFCAACRLFASFGKRQLRRIECEVSKRVSVMHRTYQWSRLYPRLSGSQTRNQTPHRRKQEGGATGLLYQETMCLLETAGHLSSEHSTHRAGIQFPSQSTDCPTTPWPHRRVFSLPSLFTAYGVSIECAQS